MPKQKQEHQSHGTPFKQVDVLQKRKRKGERYLNQYKVIKTIGKGACGKVMLAEDKSGEQYALKEVARPRDRPRIGNMFTKSSVQYQCFKSEIDIMKKLQHPNILSVYEVIDDPTADKIYLVMQYVPGGAIATLKVVDSTDDVCTPIAPDLLVGYARQIFAGLEYLHRHNVVHRDIKPDNILMDNGHVYLADFGVAETFDTTYRERMKSMMQESMALSMARSMARSMAVSIVTPPAGGPQVLGKKGTLLFIAPELWLGSTASGRAVDMWAVGVTLYTLLTGRLPFRFPEEITDPSKLRIPTEYGEEWARLLEGLLCHDPIRRLEAEEALQMLPPVSPTAIVGTAQMPCVVSDTSVCSNVPSSSATETTPVDDSSLEASIITVDFDLGMEETPGKLCETRCATPPLLTSTPPRGPAMDGDEPDSPMTLPLTVTPPSLPQHTPQVPRSPSPTPVRPRPPSGACPPNRSPNSMRHGSDSGVPDCFALPPVVGVGKLSQQRSNSKYDVPSTTCTTEGGLSESTLRPRSTITMSDRSFECSYDFTAKMKKRVSFL